MLPLLLAAILQVPPADAAVRATYRLAGANQPLTVEFDAAGVTRIGAAGNGTHLLVVGRATYVVLAEPGDPMRVMRADDLAAAIRHAGIHPVAGDAVAPPPPIDAREGEVIGPATVARTPGHLYRLRGASEAGAPTSTITIADDPALRRGGVAIRRALDAIVIPLMPLMDGDVPRHSRWMRRMLPFLDRGLPLAFGDDLVLVRLERGVVLPRGRLSLPGPALKGAALDRVVEAHFLGD